MWYNYQPKCIKNVTKRDCSSFDDYDEAAAALNKSHVLTLNRYRMFLLQDTLSRYNRFFHHNTLLDSVIQHLVP